MGSSCQFRHSVPRPKAKAKAKAKGLAAAKAKGKAKAKAKAKGKAKAQAKPKSRKAAQEALSQGYSQVAFGQSYFQEGLEGEEEEEGWWYEGEEEEEEFDPDYPEEYDYADENQGEW